MSTIQQWEHFFKSEVRHSGLVFVTRDKITSTKPSDTEVQSYIRGTSTFKISLKCKSVESKIILADCTCPAAKKGNLCKHIWAALVKTESVFPDFFDGKTQIEKMESTAAAIRLKTTKVNSTTSDAYKEKQAAYHKEAYQRQKAYLKKKNQERKSGSETTSAPPSHVQDALNYFSNNGFEQQFPIDELTLSLAKKKLSRVFHPDAGGTHDEILELNKNYDVLVKFLKSKTAK